MPRLCQSIRSGIWSSQTQNFSNRPQYSWGCETPGMASQSDHCVRSEVVPENWTMTYARICCLLIFTTKEIEDVETKAACP